MWESRKTVGAGVWWGEGGKAAIRERRQDNTNRKHYVIKDQMKQNGFITSGTGRYNRRLM